MKVYYNEYDKKKCAALKQLMVDGHISKGDIDDRSIQEVMPDDVKDYTRCHFFAGIGLWDYALNLARWEENRAVWTGSCPCQPFSAAGRQAGKKDDRHLWPEWFRLIEECKPPTIFGEQVAEAVTKGWLDDVYQGLEKEDYSVGSIILPASAVGAPHRRERLWFVAHTEHERQVSSQHEGRSRCKERLSERCSSVGDTRCVTEGNEKSGFGGEWEHSNSEKIRSEKGYGPSDTSSMGYSNSEGSQRHTRNGEESSKPRWEHPQQERSTWSSGVWIDCPDGKQRLIEPTIPLLANGFPERVGVLHCAGDAIVPQVASEFITAFMGTEFDNLLS